MRKTFPSGRFSAGSAVATAAVLEYAATEWLEQAIQCTKLDKRVRTTPRNLMMALQSDQDLKSVFPGHIPAGGVFPHVHAKLLPKKRKNKQASH